MDTLNFKITIYEVKMGVNFQKMSSKKGIQVLKKVRFNSIYAYTWSDTH